MKLSQWARETGVSYQTALRWFHADLIPNSFQMSTGTILVTTESNQNKRSLVGYARVSSADQKMDLVRQADRLKLSGAVEVISETGSGLNGKRPKLIKLLKTDVDIVVEHRDRLTRFGFEYISAAIYPRKIIVLESKELDDDLVRDITEILTVFCARLYGKRSAKNRAAKAVKSVCDLTPTSEN